MFVDIAHSALREITVLQFDGPTGRHVEQRMISSPSQITAFILDGDVVLTHSLSQDLMRFSLTSGALICKQARLAGVPKVSGHPSVRILRCLLYLLTIPQDFFSCDNTLITYIQPKGGYPGQIIAQRYTEL